jgi:ATP-dependent DNA helicase DinG
MTEMQTFADAEERLAATLDGYQSRPQQQALAAGVEAAIATGGTLIAEAGCGTGKSLAISIPAILSGRRAVISTATKALQDQVALKDLPFLAENLGVPFKHALLKGRSNYLCLAQMASEGDSVTNIEAIRSQAAEPGFSGEREDLDVEVSNRDWIDLTVSGEECPGAKSCPFGSECFAEKAKAKAQEANLVVVNHALLLTDLKVRLVTEGYGSMLGSFDTLLVDEAHELEDYAVNVFSERISEAGLINLTGEARNFARKFQTGDESATDAGDAVLGAMTEAWGILETGRLRPATIMENEDAWANLAIALNSFAEAVAAIDLGMVPAELIEKATGRKRVITSRAQRLAAVVVDLVTAGASDLVRWVEDEESRRGKVNRVIKSAPIDVSGILGPALFGQGEHADPDASQATVLVSATLAVDGRFDYVAGRLGIEDFESLNVGTPFDFDTQCRLYIPRSIPEPAKHTREAWAALATQETYELVTASSGRALLLFTSRKQMDDAYEALAPRLTDALGVRCYKQGQEPNKALAAKFKAEVNSVLFATKSFFTGVDFPGECLSLVVIDKLPFPVPTEPMTEARQELIDSRGGNSFGEYIIPVMSLTLAQGFGRLIRTVTDTGVVAILDPRLLTKGYGSKIRRSLPPAPVVENLSEVESFFVEVDAMAALNREAEKIDQEDDR